MNCYSKVFFLIISWILVFILPTLAQTSIVLRACSGNNIRGISCVTKNGVGETANTMFSEDNISGSSFSNFNGSLGASASSSNFFLSTPAEASAGYSSNFSINGNSSGVSLPMSFNFSLSGSLKAVTANAPPLGNLGSVASATYGYLIISSGINAPGNLIRGSSSLTCQGGRCTPLQGGYNGQSNIRVKITPKVNVEGSIFYLKDEDLQFLPENFRTLSIAEIPVYETNVSAIEGLVLNLLKTVGLPSVNLPAGTNASVGFDSENILDSKLSIPIQAANSSFINVSISVIASSSLIGASASANLGNTLSLESITVPADFNLPNINNIRINFDSGRSVQLTRDCSNPVITGVEVIDENVYINGNGFCEGAWIYVSKIRKLTKMDTLGTKLTLRKAGLKLFPNSRIQVQNPNGVMSATYSYVENRAKNNN